MEKEQKQRFSWIVLYQQTCDMNLVCRRCGIPKPTLRKWLKRFQEYGIEGLQTLSRRPKCSPQAKVGEQEVFWIIQLRKDRKLGARRIKNELKRLYGCDLSISTISKVLIKQNCSHLRRKPRHMAKKRYSRNTPGDRVQIDMMKIRSRLYQYTAIDDCTRMKVIALYPRKSASNAVEFVDKAIEEFPFPIQRIQTDRAREFFAYSFQEHLMECHIKFRPIRPRSPHLNGKVERSQRTDWDEFYSTVDLNDPALPELLEEWQEYYNYERPHGSLNNKTPWDIWMDKLKETPFSDEVYDAYDPSKEDYRDPDYVMDMRFQAQKRKRL